MVQYAGGSPQNYTVGGTRVEVQVMFPPDTSPATYEPSRHQMVSLHQALLYLKVGHPDFPFESRHLTSILRRYPQLEVIDMYTEDSAAEERLTRLQHILMSFQHWQTSVGFVCRTTMT